MSCAMCLFYPGPGGSCTYCGDTNAKTEPDSNGNHSGSDASCHEPPGEPASIRPGEGVQDHLRRSGGKPPRSSSTPVSDSGNQGSDPQGDRETPATREADSSMAGRRDDDGKRNKPIAKIDKRRKYAPPKSNGK